MHSHARRRTRWLALSVAAACTSTSNPEADQDRPPQAPGVEVSPPRTLVEAWLSLPAEAANGKVEWAHVLRTRAFQTLTAESVPAAVRAQSVQTLQHLAVDTLAAEERAAFGTGWTTPASCTVSTASPPTEVAAATLGKLPAPYAETAAVMREATHWSAVCDGRQFRLSLSRAGFIVAFDDVSPVDLDPENRFVAYLNAPDEPPTPDGSAADPSSLAETIRRLGLPAEALAEHVSWPDVARERSMLALARGAREPLPAARVKMLLGNGDSEGAAEREHFLADWTPLAQCPVTKVDAPTALTADVLAHAPAVFAATAKTVAAATHYRATCRGRTVDLSVAGDGTIVAFEDLAEIELNPR